MTKDKRHSHFWTHDGKLYESYYTIRGLIFRFLLNVPGIEDCDNLNEDALEYIEREFSTNLKK